METSHQLAEKSTSTSENINSSTTEKENQESADKKYYRRPEKSLFSIHRNVVEEKEKEELKAEDEIDFSLPQDKFSEAEFKEFWDTYKVKLQKKNKPLYNVLDTVNWKIDEKHNIHLIFDSSMMIFEFDQGKEDFIKKARKKLNNYAIRLHVDVSKDKQTKSHIKTRKDIYKEFVKRNPNVDVLTQRLGLDIENEP